jgi:hypothetical protein
MLTVYKFKGLPRLTVKGLLSSRGIEVLKKYYRVSPRPKKHKEGIK